MKMFVGPHRVQGLHRVLGPHKVSGPLRVLGSHRSLDPLRVLGTVFLVCHSNCGYSLSVVNVLEEQI